MPTVLYLCRWRMLCISHIAVSEEQAREWVEKDPEGRYYEPVPVR